MSCLHSRSRVLGIGSVAVALGVCILAGGQPARAQEPHKDGWINLLDSKEWTERWTTTGNWNLDEGVLALVPRKGESGAQRYEAYLWSEATYQDFEVEFEYKVLSGGRSAFLFHVANTEDPLRTGIEVRFGDQAAAPPKPAKPAGPKKPGKPAPAAKPAEPEAGAVVGIPPSKKTARSNGEWNKMRVAVRGNVIVVTLNGEVVNEVLHDHPSILNRPFTGSIGFQDRGLPVWLRNVRLRVEKDERLTVVQNSAGHAGPVRAMAFTPNGDRLVTAQGDEVRVWGTLSRELERVWRLPTPIAPVLAIAPDGRTAAVPRDAPGSEGCIWLLDIETGGYRVLAKLPKAAATGILSLSFSGNGRFLAFINAAMAGVCEVQTGRLTHVLKIPDTERAKSAVVMNKDGSQLLRRMTTTNITGFHSPHVYEVPAINQGKLPLALKGRFPVLGTSECRVALSAWAPNGSRFVGLVSQNRETVLHLWTGDGKMELRNRNKHLIKVPGYAPERTQLQFLDSGQLFLDTGQSVGGGLIWKTAWVNLNTDKVVERKFQTDAYRLDEVRSSLCSRDARFLALCTASHVALCNLETGKVRRLDPPEEKPIALTWGESGRSIAWSLNGPQQPKDAASDKPAAGLQLGTLEPLTPVQLQGFTFGTQPRDWVLKLETGDERQDETAGLTLLRKEQRLETDWTEAVRIWHVSNDAEGNPRLVVVGGRSVGIIDPRTGKTVTRFSLDRSPAAVAVSADGRFCLSSTGGRELVLSRIKPSAHLLTLLPAGSDWVAWTQQAYYAATPGGERLIGYTTRQDNFTPLTFHPVDRFRKRLYRPDIIKLVLEKGSVEEAIQAANAVRGDKEMRAVKIEDLLPPRCTLEVLEHAKGQVKLRVAAEAQAKGQPILGLRLYLDGRPFVPGGNRGMVRADVNETCADFPEGKAKVDLTWTITLPGEKAAGAYQLLVVARSRDASAPSNAVAISYVDPAKRPVLHVLTVGINKYQDPALELKFAAKDARELAQAFEKYSKGELFAEVHAAMLLDEQAHRQAVLDHLLEVRKKVKENDLFVVFFAGHGVKEKDRFYLLTVEAQVRALEKSALSGKDLRAALGEFPCQVLLLLDACHAAGFGEKGPLRAQQLDPATDDATRALTEDEIGVAVLCAAMGNESALEKEGNGLFTRAMLDALGHAAGVPYNRSNHLFYTHHLHTFVFDQVSERSNGRQHPFLSLPWVVQSFPVAKFPANK